MNELAETGEIMTEAAAQVDNVQSDTHESGEVQEQSVPLQALQAERAQRQGLQDELRVIKDHIALMQAQQSQQRQEPQKDEMDGLADDDVLTVGEAKKYLSKMNQDHKMSIQELKMTQQHPDYQDVVTKYLPEVLNKNPSLRKTLTNSQDFELAYYLAKNSDTYKSLSKKEKKNADAERIVQNSQSSGSLASVGTTSPMNHARRYKDMSDADFQKMANRNMGSF